MMKVWQTIGKIISLYDFGLVQEDSVNKMWSGYLEDVKEFDTELTEAWRQDANGLLTCVSPNLLLPASSQ